MQPTQFPNILAFVEGSMEHLFVNKNFKYVRIVPVKNGSGWTVEALCRQVDTFFRARNFHGDFVVVWLDKEKRTESSREIAFALINTLVSAGFPAERIAVMACDRMTENVILADEDFIREEFGDLDYRYTSEGRGGKHILAQMFKNKGIDYRETVQGVACLKKIRLDRCRANSPSVEAFRSRIPIDCWWFS